MATSTQSSPFLKQLASSDRRIREKALESLRTYLSNRAQFDDLELLKLWKGLYYCMWMQDKILNQQRLATDLAELVDILHVDVVMPFLNAFWKTMAREWSGIDVLRMDKYLFLVRQYLAASLRHLSRQGWNKDLVDQYLDIMAETPLNPTDVRLPNGMRYHVLDIYVDELDKVDSQREGKMPLDQLLIPVRALAENSPTKSVRERARETLDDERLKDWSKKKDEMHSESQLDDQGGGEDEEWGGIEE